MQNARKLFMTHVGAPGGAEYKMLSLCTRLPNAEVMTYEDGELVKHCRQLNVPVQVLAMPGVMQQVRREDGFLRILKAIPAGFKMVFGTLWRCRRYDLLVPMSQKSFLIASLTKPFIHKPIIWFMNDLASAEHFHPFFIRLMILTSRLSADHVILNSIASRTAWLQAGGCAASSSISYSGIDVEEFDRKAEDIQSVQALKKLFSKSNQPLVGMVGRISSWKGQHIFLHALAELDGVCGVVVGDALFGESEYAASIKRYVEESGMVERVTFAGHRDDVAQILAACDVVVHCSIAPEPFGRVIVEAMLAGTPVIATDAGGPREIVLNEQTGLLTAPESVAELVVAIRRYLDDPQWGNAMANAARSRAIEHFSVSAMVRHFEAIAQHVLEGAALPPTADVAAAITAPKSDSAINSPAASVPKD